MAYYITVDLGLGGKIESNGESDRAVARTVGAMRTYVWPSRAEANTPPGIEDIDLRYYWCYTGSKFVRDQDHPPWHVGTLVQQVHRESNRRLHEHHVHAAYEWHPDPTQRNPHPDSISPRGCLLYTSPSPRDS